MKKILSFALSALVAASSAISAAAITLPSSITDKVYKEAFIDALVISDSTWLPPNTPTLVHDTNFFFLDLNNDGKKELIAEVNNAPMGNRDALVYYLDGTTVTEAGNIKIENLSACYFPDSGDYYVLNESDLADMGISYHENQVIEFDGETASAKTYSGYEGTYYNGTQTISKYYAEDISKTVSESEYNKINEDKLNGGVDLTISYTTEKTDDYSTLSDSEKRKKLIELYESSFNGINETDESTESKANSKTESKSESTSINKKPSAASLSDYQHYVDDTLSKKYGYTNTDDITQTISVNDVASGKEIYKWSQRDGILGYDVVDMNNDGIKDMIVYIIENSSSGNIIKDSIHNNIKFEYYTSNENGYISQAGSDTLFEDFTTGANYCTCGITEIDGDKYLYAETLLDSRYFTNGIYYDYKLFTCINGELILKYHLHQSGIGSSGFSYYLDTYDNVGGYYQKTIWEPSTDKTAAQTFSECLTDLGMPSTNKTENDAVMNFKYGTLLVDNIAGFDNQPPNNPSYFFSDTLTKSFCYISMPTDSTYSAMQAYEFKSMLKVYANEVPIDEFAVDEEISQNDEDGEQSDDSQISSTSDENEDNETHTRNTLTNSIDTGVIVVIITVILLIIIIIFIIAVIKKKQ